MLWIHSFLCKLVFRSNTELKRNFLHRLEASTDICLFLERPFFTFGWGPISNESGKNTQMDIVSFDELKTASMDLIIFGAAPLQAVDRTVPREDFLKLQKTKWVQDPRLGLESILLSLILFFSMAVQFPAAFSQDLLVDRFVLNRKQIKSFASYRPVPLFKKNHGV